MTSVPVPVRGWARTFSSLQNTNYRLYWSGQLISTIGTWMQRVGQSWLVLRLTGSPLALGLVSTIQFAPILVLSLFGGVLADRFPKRRVLLVSQSVMTVQAVILATLTASGHINVTQVYVLAGVLGLATAIDNPTRQAFVVELVGPDELSNAVALNSAQFNTSRIVGPGLGGVAIATIGIAGCFYLNALSFVAVLAALVSLRSDRFFAVPERLRGNPLRQVREGLAYAVRTPDIALIMIILAILGTFGYNFTVLLPLIAEYVLHAGPVGFGGLTSAMAVGSLLSAIRIAYARSATQRSLLIGATGFSVTLFLVALSHWWVVTIPLLVLLGYFSISFTATANTRLQLAAPPALRGRVMSIYTLLFAGTTPVGSILVGWLAERVGVQQAVADLSLLCGVGVLAGLYYLRRVRARGVALPLPAIAPVGDGGFVPPDAAGAASVAPPR